MSDGDPEDRREAERVSPDRRHAPREYAKALRRQERLLRTLERARTEMEDPGALELLREIRRVTGDPTPREWAEALEAVEEAIRALKIYGARAGHRLTKASTPPSLGGIRNLPPSLQRFFSERGQGAGLDCQVRQDPDRGWVIYWKEYTEEDEVRASGQIAERPWAWLDD